MRRRRRSSIASFGCPLKPTPTRSWRVFAKDCAREDYVEGKNVALSFTIRRAISKRCARWYPTWRRGNVDLAVASGPATRAMTVVTDVPVLFAQSGDPVGVGPRQEPRAGLAVMSRVLDVFFRSSSLEKGSNCSRTYFQNSARLRCCRTRIIRESSRNGAPLRRRLRDWGSSRSMFPSSGQKNWTTRLRRPGYARADAILVFPDPATLMQGGTKIGPVRHQATAAFHVRVERILRCRRPYELWRQPRATYFWLATYADRILRGETRRSSCCAADKV